MSELDMLFKKLNSVSSNSVHKMNLILFSINTDFHVITYIFSVQMQL